MSPPTGNNTNKDGHQRDQTLTEMPGVLPSSATDCSSSTTQSSLGTASPIFDTDVSFSLSSTDKDELHKTRNHFLDLKAQNFHKKVRAQVTSSQSCLHSKVQQGNKTSSFDTGKLPHKLLANPLYEKTNGYGGLSKTKNGEITFKVTQTSPIPIRRSVDSPHVWQNVEGSLLSKHMIARRGSLTCDKNEVPASPISPTMDRTSSIRKAMSLSIKQPPFPPPLCSVCKYNAPIFGKAPRKFSFKEIERATDGFSSKNFLAQGGYGPVYKGVLADGQVVAVKQHNKLSAQQASEICSEVEVLSCVQHRNLVMLVGYCIETEWLLIYELACNGSLEKHLYGKIEQCLQQFA